MLHKYHNIVLKHIVTQESNHQDMFLDIHYLIILVNTFKHRLTQEQSHPDTTLDIHIMRLAINNSYQHKIYSYYLQLRYRYLKQYLIVHKSRWKYPHSIHLGRATNSG